MEAPQSALVHYKQTWLHQELFLKLLFNHHQIKMPSHQGCLNAVSALLILSPPHSPHVIIRKTNNLVLTNTNRRTEGVFSTLLQPLGHSQYEWIHQLSAWIHDQVQSASHTQLHYTQSYLALREEGHLIFAFPYSQGPSIRTYRLDWVLKRLLPMHIPSFSSSMPHASVFTLRVRKFIG